MKRNLFAEKVTRGLMPELLRVSRYRHAYWGNPGEPANDFELRGAEFTNDDTLVLVGPAGPCRVRVRGLEVTKDGVIIVSIPQPSGSQRVVAVHLTPLNLPAVQAIIRDRWAAYQLALKGADLLMIEEYLKGNPVTSVKAVDGKLVLVLEDGAEAPVTYTVAKQLFLGLARK